MAVCVAAAGMSVTAGSLQATHAKDRPRHELIPNWTGIIDTTDHCYYAVPPNWTVDDRPSVDALAAAPNGNATAELNWTAFSSWAAHASHVREMLKPTIVHEDTSLSFWVEYAAGWSGVHYYAAVPATTGACALRIDLNEKADDSLRATVRDIIRSVAAIR